MANPFLAEVRVMPYNFAPRGWASCDGQLMPISQNTALFSLLGTNYGGDGKSTFALPDLRARMAMGAGQGPGLSPRSLGEAPGQATVALTAAQMPAHGHGLNGGASGLSTSPANASMAPPTNGSSVYRASTANAPMAANAIGTSGSSQPHENRQPYLALTFCIALQGVFPSRS